MQKILSSAPHMRSNESTARLMSDVIVALLPASICAVYFFGISALWLILLCVGTAVGTEALIQVATKKPVTVGDMSAVLTGLLLALNLPSGVPFYIPVVGAVFAIAIVKQCFGGLGSNFVNPALAARAFLLVSWPIAMTTWVTPGVDAVSTATPLAIMKGTAEGALPSLTDMLTGNIPGCIGEVCTIALLGGGIYLLIRRVISIRIPATFIGTVALIAFIHGLTTVIIHIFTLSIFIAIIMKNTLFRGQQMPPPLSINRRSLGQRIIKRSSNIMMYDPHTDDAWIHSPNYKSCKLNRCWEINISNRIYIVHWITATKRIQIQPTIQSNWILGEPSPRLCVVPAHAEVDEAGRRRPFATLEAVADERKRGC